MSEPACVCVSDIHWGLSTLNEARQATAGALSIAEDMGVPLCILGDLNDTKDVLRGKVLNAIIEIFEPAKVKIYVLIGNHDKQHEKSQEHSLNCLRPYATIVDRACAVEFMEKAAFLPYQSSNVDFIENLSRIKPGWTVFMHQGVRGARMGEYVVDNSSVDPTVLAPYNCISGHYHQHQTVGTLTYIGSPYTISFAEAGDGPKGCLVVNHDGTWRRELFPSIRRHLIVEGDLRIPMLSLAVGREDLVWLKLRGTQAQLDTVDKRALGLHLFRREDYKLDLIYDEQDQVGTKTGTEIGTKSDADVLDGLIDNSPYDDKDTLKALWRDLTCP